MKYAQMQAAIAAERAAQPEALREPNTPTPRVKPPTNSTFNLFKNTAGTANSAEYLGTLVTPEGRVYALEANVVEHDRGDGTTGKHFEGQLFGGQMLVKRMLQGAKVDGTLPPDLVTLMQEADAKEPFNDSLEGA